MHPFLIHFFKHLVSSHGRLPVLLLSLFALALSSFALLTLKSTMGGLQQGLIGRSKKVQGTGVIPAKNFISKDKAAEIIRDLEKFGLLASPELVVEGLGKYGNYLTPLVIRGVPAHHYHIRPGDLELSSQSFKDSLLGADASHLLKAYQGAKIEIILPQTQMTPLGEMPKMFATTVGALANTRNPDVDAQLLVLPENTLFNVLKHKNYNYIRIHTEFPKQKLKTFLMAKYPELHPLVTWEENHQTLIFAFSLETFTMLFLFVVMVVLVSISIYSGLLCYFNRIKWDLVSFYILGLPLAHIYKLCHWWIHWMSLMAVGSGILLSVLALSLLHHFRPEVMPGIFVERNIPVDITLSGLLLSFFIPYGLAMLLGRLSLRDLKAENFRPVQLLRS